MPVLRSFLAACFVCWLTACAGPARMPDRVSADSGRLAGLAAFLLEGRFSLRHETGNYSGRLSWRHSPHGDEMLLSSPFGQGIAEITKNRDGVRLSTQDGKTRAATDVSTLTQEVLGFPLPMEMLAGWVLGRSRGSRVESRDENGRTLRLIENDWHVEIEYPGKNDGALPGRLTVERAGLLELRLVIDELSPLAETNETSKEDEKEKP